jgi:hypothetical protein
LNIGATPALGVAPKRDRLSATPDSEPRHDIKHLEKKLLWGKSHFPARIAAFVN